MRFSKMHGLGNDFIMINGFQEEIPRDIPAFAVAACDRKFGIGADGVIILSPSKTLDLDFSIYNSDGSEAEMCGNGIRCAAIFARDQGICHKDKIRFSTLAGEVVTEIIDDKKNLAKVNMGKPRLLPEEIPAEFSGSKVVLDPLTVGGESFAVTLVSMGNPHCVIFVDSVSDFPVEKIGPQIENDSHFPAKTNVEFVQWVNEGKIKMRVWERGCGETLACGTGACASAVAAVLNGYCIKELEVELKGGTLQIKWLEDDSLEMIGPATLVFNGHYYG